MFEEETFLADSFFPLLLACNPNEAFWKQFPRQRNPEKPGHAIDSPAVARRRSSRFSLVSQERPVDPLIGKRGHC